MANEVYTAGSTLARGNGASPEVFSTITGIQDIKLPSPTSSEIDTTDLESTAKEYLLGLADYGEVAFNGKFLPSLSIQQQLIADQLARDVHTFKVTMSDTSTCTFSATVKGLDFTGAVDDVYKWTITLRVTGEPDWDYVS